ncbi:uncharacterized protein LOC120000680 [Tripterygium wilfordii]|uniref:uncharacterized protein LOC120000680 n=1 Tax=Tripterygium wilfordii TaxID=458696 RepID=UPI0018F85C56|nr:uncharacterized protein LOC120000680 [Tripterygium wilfordii]
MDNLQFWAESIRLSSKSISSEEDFLQNEIPTIHTGREERLDLDFEAQHEIVAKDEGEFQIDITEEFSTDMIFNSRESLIEWVQTLGRNLGFVIIIRSEIGGFGKRHKLILQCEHSGHYVPKRKPTKVTGSKRCGCPFTLKGIKLKTDDDWMVSDSIPSIRATTIVVFLLGQPNVLEDVFC